MCGIAGLIYDDGRPAPRNVLERMTHVQAHRGPDDSDLIILPDPSVSSGRESIGLGHRRLSIIDLSEQARQPMSNEDGAVYLVYNGEIYNHLGLRKELVQKGHRFVSRTDSEVIVHGFEEYGTGLFNRLNGMFAFGLWDDREKTLYLVRDRYGQKPLYYWPAPFGLAFASELKGLLRHPDLDPTPDIHGLSRYLAFEYVPAPHSIVRGVKKLPPGHFLTWKKGQIQVQPYWQIDFTPLEKKFPLEDAVEEFRRLFRESVARRLMTDVPLGVFLSGGIDSSAVVAMMSELLPARNIKTFNIGFRESSFDESGHADRVARHFGTDHHHLDLLPSALSDILPQVWAHMDEPFADASIVPTWLLSQFTRSEVTVALGGDGGDELFAGYDTFPAHILAEYYEKLPRRLHQGLVVPLVGLLPVSTRNMSLDFRLKRFTKGIGYPAPLRNQIWIGSFNGAEQKGLLSLDLIRELDGFDPLGDVAALPGETQCGGVINEVVLHYSRFYLGEDILTKTDRAGMAHSLEIRAPFLDVHLAEFVNRLPEHFKFRGLTRKYLLKKAMTGRLPRDIIHRSKKGFGIPLGRWLKCELRDLVRDLLSPARLASEGYFNPRAVTDLIDDHFGGRKDNRKEIWTILMFEMWKQHYG